MSLQSVDSSMLVVHPDECWTIVQFAARSTEDCEDLLWKAFKPYQTFRKLEVAAVQTGGRDILVTHTPSVTALK